MYTKKQRICAFVICAVLLTVTAFSVLFIIKEADHHCKGENCPVCACIHQAEQTLKQFESGQIIKTTCYFVRIPFVLVCISAFFFVPRTTLIRQKVRLNN